MDYEDTIVQHGSELWLHLVDLHKASLVSSLDPTSIKTYIIETEATRAKRTNILPENRLFVSGYQGSSLKSLGTRIGQQDAKELFMCLNENQKLWVDVFNLFKAGIISETECSNCGNISRQDNCYDITSYIRLDCPEINSILKTYLEKNMNDFELRNQWRDESGCNELTVGKHRTKLSDIRSTKYLVFVVERLIKVDGQLLIKDTKITAGHNDYIHLEDVQGRTANFHLICIVHHAGNVTGRNDTQGHYLADVRNHFDNNWYRTSDSNCPVRLSEDELTDNGYIYLFKKTEGCDNSINPSSNSMSSNSSSKDLKHFILKLIDKSV